MPRAQLSSERRREKRGASERNQNAVSPIGRYLIPGTDQRVDYATYREKTGTCETCGAPMDGHPECEGCGILCGRGHETDLSSHRGHGLCGFCIQNWGTQERAMGRETSWQEFRSSKPL